MDNKLNFKSYIINICTVANQKLSALCRISNYADSDNRKLLINVFVKSHFLYCPLISIFCSRASNYRLNRVHERVLRIISEDYISNFSDLVTMLNGKTIHQRCINILMTEVFKYLNRLSPDLMKFLG